MKSAKKHQVVVIHGGNSFKTQREVLAFLKKRHLDIERYLKPRSDWKGGLRKTLGGRYEVIQPDMPNKQNARYAEWKIWFERFSPYLSREVVLVGHSLGGLFLAKYLSENKFPKKILATMLVAPAPSWVGDFTLKKNVSLLKKQGGKIFLYHSSDDPLVTERYFKPYRKLLPDAAVRAFHNRGHFNRETFPELVKDIRNV